MFDCDWSSDVCSSDLSDPVTFHAAGSYYWSAFYSGDANNSAARSGCGTELLVVSKAAPTDPKTTPMNSTHSQIANATNDTTTLSNPSLNAAGTLDYRYYASHADRTADTPPPLSGGPEAAAGPAFPTRRSSDLSDPVTFHAAGSYYWSAFYSGDANNSAARSGCGTELLVVSKAAP